MIIILIRISHDYLHDERRYIYSPIKAQTCRILNKCICMLNLPSLYTIVYIVAKQLPDLFSNISVANLNYSLQRHIY